jgi:CofH subfamily radical SAM domain protein
MRDLVEFYTNASLLELGAEADRVRREKHRHDIVTYIVDRNINYTNVCVADCGFCAFYRRPKHAEGWTLSYEQIGAKIDEAKALGGVQILMQGGHNPYIPFEWYLDLLRYIKRNHPIHVHGFSPSEVDFWSKLYRMDAREVIRELQKAGLDSIPGGGGEILVQRVRDQVAKKKASADRWLEIMEIAHQEGMKTSVTMMYGIGETLAERLEHLARVKEVQARTGGFTAFICWPLQDGRDGLPPHRLDRADRPRQRAQPPVELGHDGNEDRPDRAALRLQRLRLADDRGERRVGGEHDASYLHRGDGAPDPRRRLHAGPPPTGLLHHRAACGDDCRRVITVRGGDVCDV